MTIHIEHIWKDFNRRPVLRDMSFSVTSGESVAITGKNGSGKSTLVKIIAKVLTPTQGKVRFFKGTDPMSEDEVRSDLGFVSPYLQLYDEFSALENVEVLSKIRNTPAAGDKIESLFHTFNLWQRRNDPVRTYSSGMKQRLKYVVALVHQPPVLILDEPGSNLDEEGMQTIRVVAQRQQESGILIVATNDEAEAGWCRKRVHVGE